MLCVQHLVWAKNILWWFIKFLLKMCWQTLPKYTLLAETENNVNPLESIFYRYLSNEILIGVQSLFVAPVESDMMSSFGLLHLWLFSALGCNCLLCLSVISCRAKKHTVQLFHVSSCVLLSTALDEWVVGVSESLWDSITPDSKAKQ